MIETFLNHRDVREKERPARFLFVENHEQRCQRLLHLIEEHKRNHDFPTYMRYDHYCGCFTEAMRELLNELQRSTTRYEAMFLFIDPFGLSHTPMHLIGELMQYPKCEVLITLMSEEINRFLGFDYRTKDQQYDELFGTPEWRKIKDAASPQSGDRLHRQHDLYRQQLLTLGGAKYVRSFRMRNKHNATDYYLFFGTKSLKGLEKMKAAMWKVDPTGAYDFSDFTNPYQELLFSGPNDNDLRMRLRQHFLHQTVSLEEIHYYVQVETPYYLWKDVLRQMETDNEVVVRSASSGRKKGSFSDFTMRVHFPETLVQESLWG